MPNIALTTYCNLHCPYCFADTMIKEEDIKNITLEQFKKTLDWIGEEGLDRIGLIGGEPTLHPQFLDIIKTLDNYVKARNHEVEVILFTNGIYLDKYLYDLPEYVTILMNVNQPEAMTEEQFTRMNKNIDTFNKLNWLQTQYHSGKVTLGCNICQEIDDYSFFWNIIKKYKINRVRMSVTAPTHDEQKKDKDAYYLSMKNKLIKFCEDAWDNQVTLIKDCNQIPTCYFEKNELYKVSIVMENNDYSDTEKCTPVIDITPDFKASSCFGAYELIDCSLFDNCAQLERYANYKKMYPRYELNVGGKCRDCKKHELMQCQGGCLSFSKYNINRLKGHN